MGPKKREAEKRNEHLTSSCGSEAGKGERKQTESQVPITGKRHGKPDRRKGKDGKPRGEPSTGESIVRQNREEEGTEETEAE